MPPPGSEPLLLELASGGAGLCRGRGRGVLVRGLDEEPTAVDTKSSSTDMVSDVDRAAEAAVARVLAERRPDDGVLGEEGTSRSGTAGVRWVVDPLDGTTNFLFGVPQFAVSVAAEMGGATAGRDRGRPLQARDLGGGRGLGGAPQRPPLPGGVRPVHAGRRP